MRLKILFIRRKVFPLFIDKKFTIWYIMIPLLGLLYSFYVILNDPYWSYLQIIDSLANYAIISLLTLWFVKKARVVSGLDHIVLVLFVIYLIALYKYTLWIMFGYYLSPGVFVGGFHVPLERVNLVPFKQIWESIVVDVVLNHFFAPVKIAQIIGNFLMLSPLAFSLLYFQVLKKKNTTLFAIFCISIAIELLQFVQTFILTAYLGGGRATDVDDVIMNTISGIIGVIAYKVYSRVWGKGVIH